MFTHILTRQTKVASEIQHRDNGGRHGFGIRHLALWIFVVVQGFEHVSTQAKPNYNLGIHEFLLYFGGRDTPTVMDAHGFFYICYSR
jgi:hypothetical protein